MRMKKLAAVLSAAAMAVSSLAVSAFAAGAAPTTVPEGYGSVKMADLSGNTYSMYGATLGENDLKDVKFSAADAAAGRTDGYWCGFYIAANDAGKSGTATYERAFTYVADLVADTIAGLKYTAGSSTDGQFWTNFQYSYLMAGKTGAAGKAGKNYLVYSVKLTNDSDVSYNYLAVDCSKISEDFAFTEKCGVSGAKHDTETPCDYCGNKKAAVPAGYTDLGSDWNGSVSIDFTTAKEGDKVVIDFNKVNADAQIKIGIGSAVIMAEKKITEKDLTDNKLEYVVYSGSSFGG